MSNPDVAKGIVERTEEKTAGFVVTDSKPFQSVGMTRNNKKYVIADEFLDNGVKLIQGNTKRIQGWSQLKSRLTGRDGFPLLYICESCLFTRDYLPTLPRHKSNPEDAAEDGEPTHICDAVRYACTTRPITLPPKADSTEFQKPSTLTAGELAKKAMHSQKRSFR